MQMLVTLRWVCICERTVTVRRLVRCLVPISTDTDIRLCWEDGGGGGFGSETHPPEGGIFAQRQLLRCLLYLRLSFLRWRHVARGQLAAQCHNPGLSRSGGTFSWCLTDSLPLVQATKKS